MNESGTILSGDFMPKSSTCTASTTNVVSLNSYRAAKRRHGTKREVAITLLLLIAGGVAGYTLHREAQMERTYQQRMAP